MPIHVKLAGGWGAKRRIRKLEEKAEARRRSFRLARAQAEQGAERAGRTADAGRPASRVPRTPAEPRAGHAVAPSEEVDDLRAAPTRVEL